VLSYAPGSFQRESHDDAAVHAEPSDPREIASYRPTQWQVALSPDGLNTAILLSNSLKINSKAYSIAEPFRVYPKGRQIVWTKCSRFIIILASNGEDVQIVNQEGEVIHSVAASTLNKQVANRTCISICPMATQEDNCIIAHFTYSDGSILTIRIENQRTQIIGFATLFSVVDIIILLFSSIIGNYNLNENLNESLTKNIEIVEYLQKSNTLVVIYSNKNQVSKAYDELSVNDANMAVIQFTMTNSRRTTTNVWKLLHLLTFKRGNPITQLHNQKFLGFLGSRQVKRMLPCPIIDATHNQKGLRSLFY